MRVDYTEKIQSEPAPTFEEMDRAYVHAEVLRAQAMLRKANPEGRSLVAELIADRRAEAELE